MLKIGICDDSKMFLICAEKLIRKWSDERRIPVKIYTFNNGDKLVAANTEERLDIIFLDIIMPLLNGMDAARELRQRDKSVKIIFLTSSPEFALESYEVKAQGYVLKPIVYDKLKELLDECVQSFAEEPKNMVIKTVTGYQKLYFHEIEYAEAQNKRVFFHLRSGNIIESAEPFHSFEERFSSQDGFFKCHRRIWILSTYFRTKEETTMLVNILSLIHNTTTLLFGVYASAAFLGIRMNRKNILALLTFSCVTGVFYVLSFVLYGTSFTEQVYPFIIHIPLVLFLTFYYKYKMANSILAVLTAYLCCQISNWTGIAALTLTSQEWIYYSVRICVTIIVFILLVHYVSDITAQLLQKPARSLAILGFMPFVYYIFDYMTSKYTLLLYSGSKVVGEFLGFVLCITYLMFLFLYFKEYEANKEAEQRNQIMEMKRIQSEKELDAIRRSEHAVSILRHDMRHFLLSISSYIENNDNEKALEYINEVIHTSDKTVTQRYCKNEIINLILSSHESELEHNYIHFEYSIQLPETLAVSDVDMTAILSNALENAIHAVLKLPEARREIKLDMRLNEEKLLISLKNTYADKPDFMNGLPYTSEAGHGFGTKSIWYVAEKLNGSCQFSVTDTYFILRVIL